MLQSLNLLKKRSRSVLFHTFVVHLPVSVNISFSDHLVHFLICELLAEVRHDVAQFCSADVAVSVLERGKSVCYRHNPALNMAHERCGAQIR